MGIHDVASASTPPPSTVLEANYRVISCATIAVGPLRRAIRESSAVSGIERSHFVDFRLPRGPTGTRVTGATRSFFEIASTQSGRSSRGVAILRFGRGHDVQSTVTSHCTTMLLTVYHLGVTNPSFRCYRCSIVLGHLSDGRDDCLESCTI